jgi:hypothetical protein
VTQNNVEDSDQMARTSEHLNGQTADLRLLIRSLEAIITGSQQNGATVANSTGQQGQKLLPGNG